MNGTSTIYFDVSYALDVHKILITSPVLSPYGLKAGGLPGVMNADLIESVLEHIKNDTYYPDFLDKLTHLVFSVIKHHAFNDANKRSSIALGAYFLEINGLDNLVIQFIRELENIVVWVADDKIDKPLLKDLIGSLLENEDYPEELKLRYLNAITPTTQD